MIKKSDEIRKESESCYLECRSQISCLGLNLGVVRKGRLLGSTQGLQNHTLHFTRSLGDSFAH
jgi:hypothetical protein